MNDKQKINELVKLQGEDSNRIAKLLIENVKLREAAQAVLAHLEECQFNRENLNRINYDLEKTQDVAERLQLAVNFEK